MGTWELLLAHRPRLPGLWELALVPPGLLGVCPGSPGKCSPHDCLGTSVHREVLWALEGSREGIPAPHQGTYILGVPGLVAQRRPGQEDSIGRKDGQQQQGADSLPGHPPVKARPPPCHPRYVITEPGTEMPGLGRPTLCLQAHPLSRQPPSRGTETRPAGAVPRATAAFAPALPKCPFWVPRSTPPRRDMHTEWPLLALPYLALPYPCCCASEGRNCPLNDVQPTGDRGPTPAHCPGPRVSADLVSGCPALP